MTSDVKDFVPLLRGWVRRGKTHAGCILIPGSVGHERFGIIITGITNTLAGLSQEDWKNRVEWLRRA